MRQTMLFSGLEAIAYNQNRQAADLKFYEFGKVYSVKEDKYVESQRFSIFITGDATSAQWNQKAKTSSFYNIKALVDGILQKMNVNDATLADSASAELAFGLNYVRNGKTLVSIGKVAPAALKKAGVEKEVFYADINFDQLITIARKNKIVYQEISKFPSVKRDLSMLVDKAVTFDQLKRTAQRTERKLLQDVDIFDVYEGDKLPAGKKSYALSFVLQDAEKTLTDKAIDSVMQKIMYNLEKEAGAEIRK
jgi:phenylalanyl-tRNA synthetase beta chain